MSSTTPQSTARSSDPEDSESEDGAESSVKLRPPNEFTFTEWADKHRVLPFLLPFEYSENNLRYVEAIRTVLDEKPATAKTVNAADVKRELGQDIEGIVNIFPAIFNLFGAWKAPTTDSRGRTQYINPGYAHIDSLADKFVVTAPDARREVLDQYARLGLPDTEDIAPRFGITPSAVRSFIDRTGYNWSERHEDGVERLARTWETLHQWGYQYVEIADIFGVHPKMIECRIKKAVPADWDAPDDPTVQWE